MRILHVPFGYYPDPVGGTEVYVASLGRAQRKQGMKVAIASPSDRNETYLHDGIEVYRFQTARSIDLTQLYGEGDAEAARSFLEILQTWQPDLVHLHAFTSGASLKLVRAARQYGAHVVFTYHTPTVTCSRGTLLRWGTEVCDGQMETRRCTRCSLHGKGVPIAASWVLGSLPARVGEMAGQAGLTGGVWTAIRMSELVELRHRAARALFAEVDHIFAVCEWVRDLLIRNGAAADKITLCRQGLSHQAFPAEPFSIAPKPASITRKEPQLRFAYLGRLDRVKGVEILIDALLGSPQLPVSLDIFAIVQGQDGQDLKERLLRKAASDHRIRFLPALTSDDVVDCLRSYDALIIPSQGFETGPLVVYEAFAAGIPVIGTALGGIAELVRNGENGILVEPHSAPAWAKAITRVRENPDLLGMLRRAPGPVRTMEDVAVEVCQAYGRVLANTPSSTCQGAGL